MEFLKKHVGQPGTLISIMDLPSLLCIHRGMGNPLVFKTEIHHSGIFYTLDLKTGKYPKC